MRFAPAVRLPAVSGLFYPADANALSAQIDTFLYQMPPHPPLDHPPKALIVPHAGYLYSGPIAAHAYQLLLPFAETIRRILLFGPAHRVPLRGLALPESSRFRTPLGEVAVDVAAAAIALQHPAVHRSEEAHLLEHAIEVQLPFLQRVLSQFTIVPFVVGWTDPIQVAEVMLYLWGGPETLIVVSSDLSHYHTEQKAHQIDRQTIERILRLDATLGPDEACGALAIDGLLLAAQRQGVRPELLAYGTSADADGPRERVVGYTSIAWFAHKHPPASLH